MREESIPDLSPLDEFGAFIVKHLHDSGIRFGEKLLAGSYRAPAVAVLQSDLQTLEPSQRAAVSELVSKVLCTAIHDFLFALQEQADFENHICLTVRGTNVVEASDGIHGEAYGPDGWFARFSTSTRETAS
jgi:hypothetical protein